MAFGLAGACCIHPCPFATYFRPLRAIHTLKHYLATPRVPKKDREARNQCELTGLMLKWLVADDDDDDDDDDDAVGDLPCKTIPRSARMDFNEASCT